MKIPWRKRERGGASPNFLQELDDMIERYSSEEDWLASRLPEVLRGRRFPAVDLAESTTELRVEADLPGMDEDAIGLEITGKHLLISGERAWDEERPDEELHRVERFHGKFQRSIPLPEGLELDPDAIHATYDKGVLRVRIPKLEPTPPRRIRVRPAHEAGPGAGTGAGAGTGGVTGGGDSDTPQSPGQP